MLIGCDSSARAVVQGPTLHSRSGFSRALVPEESRVCFLVELVSCALVWSEAAHQVCWF